MATEARRLALGVLLELERGRRPLADVLAAREIEGLPARERDFLHELVLGTLRRRGTIDHSLRPLLERPLEDLDVAVAAVLRLGAHQLLHLRLPARAAVHESVELVRALHPRATAFVNAVLRRLAREGGAARPSAAEDPLGWLTTEGSLPPWLAERWLSALGAESAVARARALGEPPRLALRLNPRRAEAAARARDAGLELEPLALPGAHRLLRGRPGPLAREGLVYVQDLGSQLAARLAAREGRILDACAAPGGKSLLLSDLVGPQSMLIAAEPSPPRMRTLQSLLSRWGAGNVRLLRADAERPPFAAAFDSVLLDAPCSGLGTLGRHPDIRWRARPEELPRHAQRQRALLEAQAGLVRPGGTLVYSVCSLEPEETEHVVRDFRAAHPEFEGAALPGWCEPYRAGDVVRTLPERDGWDGFFVAPLLRRADPRPSC